MSCENTRHSYFWFLKEGVTKNVAVILELDCTQLFSNIYWTNPNRIWPYSSKETETVAMGSSDIRGETTDRKLAAVFCWWGQGIRLALCSQVNCWRRLSVPKTSSDGRLKYIFHGYLNHSAFASFPKVGEKSTCSISCSFRITVSGETRGILGRAGE